MNRKLLENYGDELVISNEDGKPDLATLKSLVNTILRKYYKAPKDIDIHLQKILLLTTAAKLINTNIKLINTDLKFYPFLETLEQNERRQRTKISSHWTVYNASCSTTKSFIPLQIGFALQMHHHYAQGTPLAL